MNPRKYGIHGVLSQKSDRVLMSKKVWDRHWVALNVLECEIAIAKTVSKMSTKGTILFEDVLKVLRPEGKSSGRFDVILCDGSVMAFLAKDEEEATSWVKALHQACGTSMAVHRVQRLWRIYYAKRRFQRIVEAKKSQIMRAMNTIKMQTQANAKDGGDDAPLSKPKGARVSWSGVEGTLTKTDQTKGLLMRGTRSRYFVLSKLKMELAYYDTFASRLSNTNGKTFPIRELVDCRFVTGNKNECSFFICFARGKIIEVKAASRADAVCWVKEMRSVLPQANAAALLMQTKWKGVKA